MTKMPDRYGENADYRSAYAIAECGLCDDDGYRGGHPCDHIDHASAAARGMALIRAAMGWKNRA